MTELQPQNCIILHLILKIYAFILQSHSKGQKEMRKPTHWQPPTPSSDISHGVEQMLAKAAWHCVQQPCYVAR